ncbi:MAG: glycosyltransferase family 2 protein [Nitrospiraceae bacterium]|nr:MAG: glycosyltransferase family 2 protein [Nitrospiraceae bacterium]
MENFEATVVMPSLNEEKNVLAAITDTLKSFADFGINGEIIVINDGSTDRTKDVVTGAMTKDSRIRLINHDTSQGIGASFWDGVRSARGEIVTMFPGDNENDPWETFQYYKLLEHVDIVIPFVFNRQVRSLFRNALSFIYRFIINTTFLVNFNYTNGTILYRKSVLDELTVTSTGFFFQTDILIRSVKNGYLFAEVPYRLNMRNAGKSKAVSFPSLMKVMKGYLRLVSDVYFGRNGKSGRKFAEGSSTARRYEKL